MESESRAWVKYGSASDGAKPMGKTSKKSAPTLETRVRRLEGFRYRMLGMVNAQNALLVDLWCNWLAKNDPEPLVTLEKLRENWLANAERPNEAMRGIEPAHLDVVSQEYRDAVIRLTNDLILKFPRPIRRPR
jgi:hypothetical protein